MANGKLKGLDEYTEILVDSIKKNSGSRFITFLDTCAILDFENYADQWQLKDKSNNISRFYDCFCKSGFPIYVNKRVWQEVKRHRHNHSVAGRAEVSQFTFNQVTQMYRDYEKFLQQIVATNPKTIDDVRYDVHWASQLSFSKDHKKSCIDGISRTDRSLVSAAVWSRYAQLSPGVGLINPLFDTNSSHNGLDSVVIVSPDEHVSETVNTLTDHKIWPDYQDPLFTHDSIKVVSTRGY